jgi:hypothetical protein
MFHLLKNINPVGKGGGMLGMQTMSTIRREFVATHIRSQINQLRRILTNIEEENTVDGAFTQDVLREIEAHLRQIRKLCIDN